MKAQDGRTELQVTVTRLTPQQVQQLDLLGAQRRLARSVLIRNAVDLFLAVNNMAPDSEKAA